MNSDPGNPKPIEIRRLGESGMRILWDDGVNAELSSEILRKNCPCAECREKRGDDSHATPLTPGRKKSLAIVSSSIDEELSLEAIWAVGNYAIGLRWADGHQTGIYTYKLLQQLTRAA